MALCVELTTWPSHTHLYPNPLQPEGGKGGDDADIVLPPPGQPQTITCVAITPNFIITGSKQVGGGRERRMQLDAVA